MFKFWLYFVLENATNIKEADTNRNKHYSGSGYNFCRFHETGISLGGVFLSEVFGISLGGGISLRKAWYFAQSGISLKKQPQIAENSSSSLKQQEV